MAWQTVARTSYVYSFVSGTNFAWATYKPYAASTNFSGPSHRATNISSVDYPDEPEEVIEKAQRFVNLSECPICAKQVVSARNVQIVGTQYWCSACSWGMEILDVVMRSDDWRHARCDKIVQAMRAAVDWLEHA